MTNLQVFGLFLASIPLIAISVLMIKDVGIKQYLIMLAMSSVMTIMIIIGVNLAIGGSVVSLLK